MKTNQKRTFPQVWKLNKGNNDIVITIVYRNRVETYTKDFIEIQTKAQIDKINNDCVWDYEDIFGKGWNAHHEVDMLEGNRFKRVGSYHEENDEVLK